MYAYERLCQRFKFIKTGVNWGISYAQLNFFKDFIYLFLERGERKKKEGENHQCVVASHAPTTGYLACNPGMFPEWE